MTQRGLSRMKMIAALGSAATAGLAFGAESAAAATLTATKSFDVGGGTTCSIVLTQEFPISGFPQVARARTEVTGGSGPNAAACRSTATAFIVDASWTDPDGHQLTVGEAQDGTFSVERDYAPVKSNLVTHHRVGFGACGCSTPTWALPGTK